MNIREYIENRKYPGRILVAGSDLNGKALLIYAVMGRSKKSRNRILKLTDDKLTTELYVDNGEGDDLIIYSAKESLGNKLLLGNGNHITHIARKILDGKSLSDSLVDIFPEPDKPNYTPRIALLYDFDTKCYEMAIVRYKDDSIDRVVWKYPCIDGVCHIIHTYENDGNPLISFQEDPKMIENVDNQNLIDDFWHYLDHDNKVAMYFNDSKKEGVVNQREAENGQA